MSGNNIGESFCMQEADVSITMLKCGQNAVKNISDFIIGEQFDLIFDSLKLGRNIYENIRKFIQY